MKRSVRRSIALTYSRRMVAGFFLTAAFLALTVSPRGSKWPQTDSLLWRTTESQERRSAVHAHTRLKAKGLCVGVWCFSIVFVVGAILRAWLISVLGFTAFVFASSIVLMATFLTPQALCRRYSLTDDWLHCPTCGDYLGGFRALRRLNAHSECGGCGAKIAIAPIDGKQKGTNWGYVFAGMLGFGVLTLNLVGWLTLVW